MGGTGRGWGAVDGAQGCGGLSSQPNSPTATTAPTSCAAMNSGAELGAMPAKLSDRLRATVTAGLANEVEAVNQ